MTGKRDYYVTKSHEERIDIINLFLEAGFEVGYCTEKDRYDLPSFRDYPVLYWEDGEGLGGYGTINRYERDAYGFTELTKQEFLNKAGIMNMEPTKDLKRVEL